RREGLASRDDAPGVNVTIATGRNGYLLERRTAGAVEQDGGRDEHAEFTANRPVPTHLHASAVMKLRFYAKRCRKTVAVSAGNSGDRHAAVAIADVAFNAGHPFR